MSNLIHDEILKEQDEIINHDSKDSLVRTYSNYSQDKKKSVLKLCIDIEEPVYEEVQEQDKIEDVDF